MTSGNTDHPPDYRGQAQIRLEFIWTIFWDTLVVASAILARAFALWLVRRLAPTDNEGWVVRDLGWIADVGIVAAAGVFAVFDLSKRVVVSFRALWRSLREED